MAATAAAAKTPLEIPLPYRQLFDQYAQFNAVQSALLDDLLHSDSSVVLVAPTGAGKTVAFELAFVRLLQQSAGTGIPPKAVYVAPLKALCAEKFHDWQRRLQPLNIVCVQITGDSVLCDLQATLRGAQLIVTTPEKWDSLTRRWSDCCEVFGAVRLFMIDEVHLLNEDGRGPILEAIVARMCTIARLEEQALRFVVASATLPNYEDLTTWIKAAAAGGGGGGSNVAQLVFSDMLRPCPLEKHILGFNSRSKGFQFDMSLNYRLPDILRKYAEQKATLIFCNSRKSAEMAATALSKDTAGIFSISDQQKTHLTQHSQRLQDIKLRRLIAHGVAFHHAGLSLDDRKLVEELFRCGLLLVLLSTNTLAMGVNLPAHLVVVKSTESYCRGSYEEYAESTLLQMIGRAGRMQYDTKGVAVILTYSQNVRKYENLINGNGKPVESHLHKHLVEHLNSEIASQLINNVEVAMKTWIRSTYLYVRALRDPVKYGLEANMDKDIVESKLEEMCMMQINALHVAGLVTRNGLDVQSTAYGKLMAKYYLSFETMKLFRQIRGTESFLEILNMIVRCKEFSEFSLRVNEKKTLNELNASPIRFPIRGRIKTQEEKISCLIQATLGNVQISSPGLTQEAVKMLRIGDRVAKCLLEYLRLSESHLAVVANSGKEETLGSYKAVLHAVTIAKCFHAKLWENSEYAAKQLRKIGVVYSRLLANAGKTSLKSIATTDARTIELILNKSSPFGDEILQQLQTFPEYSLQITTRCAGMVHVYIRQVNEAFIFNDSNSMVIVGDSANNMLLFQENLDSILLECGFLERTLKIPNLEVEKINAHIIHSTLVGIDQHASIVINVSPQEDQSKNPVATKRAATKRKRQSTIDESMVKIKKIPCATEVDVCGIPDDTFLKDLNRFCYSKPKLQKNKTNTRSISTTMDDEPVVLDKSQPTVKNINNNTQASNTTLLVQKRVTDYFTDRKQYACSKLSRDMSEDLSRDMAKYSVNDKLNNTTLDITMQNSQNVAEEISMNSINYLSWNIEFNDEKIGKDTTEDISNKSLKDTTKDISMHSPMQVASYKDSSMNFTLNISKDTPSENFLKGEDIPMDLVMSTTYGNNLTRASSCKHYRTQATTMLMQESCQIVSAYENKHHFHRPAEVLDLSTVVKNLHDLDLSNATRKMQKNSLERLITDKSQITRSTATSNVIDFGFKKTANLNLSRVSKQRSEILNLINDTPTSGITPNQKTNTSPSTETFHLWFKVAKSFQKLKPDDQNLKNFIKTYEMLNPNEDLQQQGHHPSTANQNDKPHVSTSKRSSGTSNIIATSANYKNKENTSSRIKERSSRRVNPFRLRIFENNANSSSNSADLSRSRVESINASVMQDVLNIKYEQNNEISEESFMEIERELMLEATQSNIPISFDEYMRIFLESLPKDSKDTI